MGGHMPQLDPISMRRAAEQFSQQLQAVGRAMRVKLTRKEERACQTPNPIDIYCGEYETRMARKRAQDRLHEATFAPLMRDANGGMTYDELRYPMRGAKWCDADHAWLRLMNITRLDRSRLD